MQEFLLFVATFLVIACIILPLMLRYRFRYPVHPEYQEVLPDDERIPASAKGFFREVAADLELLGFDPVACLIDADTLPGTTGYIAVFENRPAGDAAAAMAVFAGIPQKRSLQTYAVEFSTDFADGTGVNTGNATDPDSLGAVPWRHVCRMPGMADLSLLYRVHLGLVARHGDSAVKQLPAEGTHAAEFRESTLRQLQAQTETGRLYLDAKGECFRFTVKGMVLAVSSALWPFSAIRRWLIRRQARVLLEELNLRADYQTIDYRRRAPRYAQIAAETSFELPQSAPGGPPVEGLAPVAEQPPFACPVCDGLVVADHPSGTQVRCPLCQQVVTVPSPRAPPAAAGIEPAPYAAIDHAPVRKGLAVGALVCGIVGLFPLCFPIGLVGLILGIVAVRRASRQPERYGGKGLAIGGICTGVVGLVLSLLLGTLLLDAAEGFTRRVCEINLRAIGTAMTEYARAHNGALPPDFETLVESGSLLQANFWCVNSDADPESADLYECYQYIPGQTTRDDLDNVLVYEKASCHDGAGGTVLFLDDRVEFVEPYTRVENLVRQTKRRLATVRDE